MKSMKRSGKTGRGGARPGAGRKPLPEGVGRTYRVMINLTAAEHDALVGASGDELPGSYARRVVLRHLGRLKRGGSRHRWRTA